MTSRRSVPARGRMRPRRGLPYGCGWSSSSEFSFFITYVGVRRTGRRYPQYMNRGSDCGGTSPVLVTMYREPVASSHRSPSKPPVLKTRTGRMLPTQRGVSGLRNTAYFRPPPVPHDGPSGEPAQLRNGFLSHFQRGAGLERNHTIWDPRRSLRRKRWGIRVLSPGSVLS